MSKQLTAVIVGAGDRGRAYAGNMLELPEKFRVVAVADPIKVRREHIQNQ